MKLASTSGLACKASIADLLLTAGAVRCNLTRPSVPAQRRVCNVTSDRALHQ